MEPRPHPARQTYRWSRLVSIIGLCATAAAIGCAPPPLYRWGKYEDSLYLRYASGDTDRARAMIEETVAHAQQDPVHVPPGLYADYGFLLFQRGEQERAVEYFEKEARAFPESAPLMNKLTEKIRQLQTGAKSDKGGASDREAP